PVLTGQDRFILTGQVFCGLGPVWLWSFSSYETGLPNTNLPVNVKCQPLFNSSCLVICNLITLNTSQYESYRFHC
ncbi:hypothetical protein K443DRAFT_106375, partial [Laccaria amethystina LaAM-08-1]